MYLLTQSMVEKQSLSFFEKVSQEDTEGEKYSKYGIGMSVAAIPFYLAGKGVATVLSIDPAYSTLFCVSMINAIVSALACVLLYRFGCERFGFSHQTSSILALGFGLSTMAWCYSEDFMSEPLTSFFILWSAFVITGKDPSRNCQNRILGGVLFGVTLTFRLASLVSLPGFFFFLWQSTGQGSGEARAKFSAILKFLIPVIFFVSFLFLYNYVRFQNILETGYEEGFVANGWVGFIGILFSPGKSIFLYNPLIIVGCLALPVFFRDQTRIAFLFGWIVLAHLLLFSFWHSWFGGWGWGPRLMLVTFPYLILPVGFLLEGKGKVARSVVISATTLGILIQIPSVTVNIARYYYDLRSQYQDQADHMLLYSPAHSPLIGQVKQVATVFKNLQDKEFIDKIVSHAQAKTKFLGKTDKEVLEKGLAINVPNFWWFFLYLLGYPAVMTFFPAGILVLITVICGYKIYRFQEVDP